MVKRKQLKFDFTKKWSELTNTEKAEFTRKVKQIEIDAIERLADLENVDFDVIANNITPLDPQCEWEWEDNVEKGLPLDIHWVDFEIQFFREELREREIL